MLAQAGPGTSGNHGLDRVVALIVASNGLLSLSYRVNLLAIDAMLQSKRSGGGLLGFDAVASQMRAWTRDLHGQLEQLNQQCYALVARSSQESRQRRVQRLLDEAVEQGADAELRRVQGRHRQAIDTLGEEVERDRRRVRNRLSDLSQMGTMAVVLSRSAMIEAATGTDEQRALLGQVSQEFFQHSQIVVQTIRSTLKQMNED